MNENTSVSMGLLKSMHAQRTVFQVNTLLFASAVYLTHDGAPRLENKHIAWQIQHIANKQLYPDGILKRYLQYSQAPLK